MEKTTIYLPAELKRSIEEIASERGCSEAEVIREALTAAVSKRRHPRPRIPLFRSKASPTLAENIEKALRGFGER